MARKVIGMCNLCFEDTILSKGHIVPRWSSNLEGVSRQYRRHIGKDPAWPSMDNSFLRGFFIEQETMIGLPTEYLFCEKCDNSLGPGEQLLREIVHPSEHKPSSISEMSNSIITLNGEMPVKQLYLALGGLLLKADLAQVGGFENATPLSEENRQILLDGMKNSTLSKHITIVINKIYSFENFIYATDVRWELLGQIAPLTFQATFEAEYEDDTIEMVFIFGGLMINIFFTPEESIDSDSTPDFIQLEILPIDVRYFLHKETTVFGQYYPSDDDLRELREKMREIPLKSKCPCKVPYTHNGIKINRDFGNCCYRYWGFGKF